MSRADFKRWLIHYKEYGNRKAENLCTIIDKLSDKAIESGVADYPVYNISSYTNLGKWRRAIGEELIVVPNDSKAIALFGDYLDYVTRTNTVFSDIHEVKLVDYIKSMSMTYSYKAVLLLVMVDNIGLDGKIDVDLLVNKMIEYYNNRKTNNEIVEQKNSIFANSPIDMRDAKKNVISNPVQALEKAGVIKKESNSIRLLSEYYIAPDDYNLLKDACVERLSEYYNRITESVTSIENDISPLESLEIAINNIKDVNDRNNCILAYSEYKKSIGLINPTEVELIGIASIQEDDPRKIGKLVRETMSELSASGYSFSQEEFSWYSSKEWSKEVLGLYYPLIRPYSDNFPLEEQIKDHLGNGRYYKQVFAFGDKKVLITSEWYKENKTKYIKWFNRLVEQLN